MAAPPGQTFTLTVGQVVTNGVPGTGAGSLDAALEQDFYHLSVTAGQQLYFQDRGAAPGIDWRLLDPKGQILFNDRLDLYSAGRITFTADGDYTLRVLAADGSATGWYSFAVLNAPDEVFTLPLGSTVTNNVPGPGAGALDSPGRVDVFRVTMAAGQKFFFYDLGADPGIDWAFFDPGNHQLFRDRLDGYSPGWVTAQSAGVYELRVLAADDGHWTGKYSFEVLESADQVFPLTLGLTVTNGAALPGAGQLEKPGQVDVYRFTGSPGEKLFFYDLGADPGIDWGFYDASNTQLFRDRLDGYSPGRVTLGTNAPYELRIFGSDDGHRTGNYGFAVFDAPDEIFPLPIGSRVTNGVPAGAGKLESPGIVHVFRITAAEGQKVFFRDLGADQPIDWALVDSSGQFVFRDRLDGYSPGRFTLHGTAPYELRVSGSTDSHWTGNYSFAVLDAPDTVFNLPFNVVVTNGVPGPGAGVLETAGQVDAYRFNASAGTALYFNDLGADPQIDWALYDSGGQQIFRDRLDGFSPGRFSLPTAGAYEVRVFGASDGSATGKYSFSVLAPIQQEFTITVGSTVTNNAPGPGAGVINASGEQDIYDFQVPAGRTVYLRDYGSTSGSIDLALVDDAGTSIGVDRLDGGSWGNVLLTKGGKYQLIARGSGDGKATGSYSFALLPPAPVITKQPDSLVVVLGRSATLSIGVQSDSPVSYQWFHNGSIIPGATNATLAIAAMTPDQVGSYNVVLNNDTASTTSALAFVSARPLLPASAAERTTLPPVPGNGVAIDLFNGVGGGAVPTPDLINALSPDGATLSPVIDFPHPGQTITVGNSFDSFFADATTPPDIVRSLSARNFILRTHFFLRISRDLDQDLSTPEIDLSLGVGSDDGFYLMVGANVLGQSSDRGFAYTWMPVAFAAEGLYPVTLFYAANAAGASGLELSWQTARGSDPEIIPQSALYVAANVGDHLITFEELAPGTGAADQFLAQGIRFSTASGSLQVMTNSPDRFVPVSPTHVYGDPAASPGAPGELDLTFVAGSTTQPALTDFVSFFLLNAQDPGAVVTAFNSNGGLIHSNTFHAGGASQELVAISQPGIARVHVSLGAGSAHAALDNLSFTTPRSGGDLTAGIIDVPASVLPGGSLNVIWVVTNAGIAAIQAPWTEQVFLVAAGSPRQPLGIFTATNNLPAGGFEVRTQTVSVPITGLAGALRVGVNVDLYDEVAELSEGNNTALASQDTVVPLWLSLDTPSATTVEGAPPLVIQVVRNGGTTTPLTVALTNSNPTQVQMPSTLAFAAGQAQASFSVAPLLDGIVDGPQAVDLSATADGFAGGALSLLIEDADTPQLQLALASAVILEGETLNGQVSRPNASTNALTVFFRSSLPARTLFPDSVTIPAGATNAAFQVMALSDGLVSSPRTASVTAEAPGYLASNPFLLSIVDTDLPHLSLSLSRTVVSEGDGPRAAVATVSRASTAGGEVTFAVLASLTNLIQLPSRVTLPAGDLQASFTVGAVDDTVANPPRTVSIELVPIDLQTGARISDGVAADLTITDNDGPGLSLALDRRLVPKGLGKAATATVTRRGNLASSLTISLSSDAPSLVAFPASLTLPPGSATGSFAIDALDDHKPGATRVVDISAAAPGFASGSDALIVSDLLLPDLVVTNVAGPVTADTESFVGLTYRIVNQGLGSFATNVLTRLFLSTSPGTGNDLFAGNFTFTGSIPPGEFFEQALQVRLPATPGDYWVIATTDLEDHVAEILENNNSAISVTPIHVREAYTATATTDATTVPAGAPIVFRGRALKAGSNVPAPQVPVHLHLLVRDTRRVLLAVTDDDGNFSVTFSPLPNEAGNYAYAAAHPGVAEPDIQGRFAIVGLRARVPSPGMTLVENSPQSLQIPLENLSDQPLSGLQARVVSGPANVTASPSLPNPPALPGSGVITLTLALKAADATITSSNLVVRISSGEGATADATIPLTIQSRTPRLVTDPPTLVAGMKRGVTSTFDFELINSGGANSGPITLLTPQLGWLRLISPTGLPGINAGQSNRVSLQFSPPAELPLGDYTGALAVQAGTLNLSIPFNFRALSEAKGDLRITAVDEYTYYAEGSPPVTNAAVTVRDLVSGTVLANGVTDSNGQYVLAQIPEGYYDVLVSADQHINYHDSSLIRAGVTNDVQAFLSREAVRYLWTVEPTEIEDHTKISIETEFETFVPIPVVTIDPAVIDLAEINADVTQIDLRIENHGLLAANDFKLSFSSHPDWQLEPLVNEFGALPARSSLVVPLTIRRLKSLQPQSFQSLKGAALHALSGGPCGIFGGAQWTIICGTEKHYSAPIQILNAGGDCPYAGGGNWGGNGSVGGPYVTVPVFPVKLDCSTNQCKEFDLPQINLSGILKPLAKGLATAANAYLAAQSWNLFLGLELDLEPEVKGKIGICCTNNTPKEKITAEVSGEAKLNSSKRNVEISTSTKTDDFALGSQTGQLQIDAKLFLGTKAVPSVKVSGSYSQDCAHEKPVYEITLSGAVEIKSGLEGTGKATFSVNGKTVKEATALEIKAGIAGRIEFSLSINSEGEKKFCYKSDGLYLFGKGQVFNSSVDWFSGGKYYLIQPLEDCGPTSAEPDRILSDAIREMESQLTLRALADQNLTRQSAGADEGGAGVCARIRLKLDQDLVLTRNAFNASLEIVNNDPQNPLEDVSVQLNVLDGLDASASGLFDVETNQIAGLKAVDGTGTIPVSSKGTASWLIIPGRDAAPAGPTPYKVGGVLSYRQGGRSIVVPLSPVPITVLPDPRLQVQYFHQRDVYSDDPFTSIVEPSIPYSLAVLIHNTGKGDAHNVHITSAQPQIVDNEKGLLIDFKIIGTEVAGQPATPSLTVDFGDIPAGGISIGRWLFTSTLQGLFDTYSATIEHTAGPQDHRSSLLDDLSIHEMTHLVQAGGSFEDGKPDFLVNDDGDPDAIPDTLYLSDGSTNQVSISRVATFGGSLSTNNLSVQMTAFMSDDWTYLRVPDPGQDKFKLKRVVRSDNREISFGTNVWTTDRTFIGRGRKPIRENILHLLDYGSTGTYTLFYEPVPAPESVPPSSQVSSLPAASYSEIPISWSGSDNPGGSGLAFYDIYVSVDGGPFASWLQHSDQTGSVYSGQLGHKYAFYSVATDNAGNREDAPLTADAQTTVSLQNHPPTLDPIADRRLNEGDLLVISPTAVDPDGDRLTWSLVGAAPTGVQINPDSGLLTWQTGAGLGPSTNRITVQVLDSGIPRLGALRAFTVILDEKNFPPEFDPVAAQTIHEGQLLQLSNVVNDPDWPRQTITFALPNPPEGASIDPATGVLSWRPNDIQGGTTYSLRVVATDSGVPSLSATQAVQITVLDTQSDFVLSLGSTNVTGGASGFLPLYLQSAAQITNVSFDVVYPNGRLANLTLQPSGAGVASATLENVGTNRGTVRIAANPGAFLPSGGELARLVFTAATNESEVLPFILENGSAGRANGAVLANGEMRGAPLYVINGRALLGISLVNRQPAASLYSPPLQLFELEYTTNLTGGSWQSLGAVLATNQFTPLAAPALASPVFLRARAVDPNSSRLFLAPRLDSGWDLFLSGRAGGKYTIQSRGLGDAIWRDAYTVIATNGTARLPEFLKQDSGRLYRGVLHPAQ